MPDDPTCDECESPFYAASSAMKSLCPECAHLLYGHPNCDHSFAAGSCTKCGWNGARSVFTEKLKPQN